MKQFRKPIILAIAGFGILICLFMLRGKTTHEPFDTKKWRESNLNEEANPTLRWDMMNSLRKGYDLVGMKEKDIIQLLGKPDSKNSKEIYYNLGYTGRGINTGTLRLEISNGIVVNMEVSQG